MAGYSGTPLLKKLGLKDHVMFTVINPPVNYSVLVGKLPPHAKEFINLRAETDFIHYFTTTKNELKKNFPKLKKALSKNGTLWISWPKKSSGVETDVSENLIREVGLENGLVDVKVCAVDETWSGLKFVYRVKDRV